MKCFLNQRTWPTLQAVCPRQIVWPRGRIVYKPFAMVHIPLEDLSMVRQFLKSRGCHLAFGGYLWMAYL